MLFFLTVLPINDIMTKDAFIELVIDWYKGGTHKSNITPDIGWSRERNIRRRDDDR